MFLGRYDGVLDEGYLPLPPEWRAQLALGLVVTRGVERCLSIYPLSQWQVIAEALRLLPFTRAHSRALSRLLFAEAHQSPLDEKGRLFLSEALRGYAKLEREVVLIGLGTHLEVWDATLWQEANRKIEEEAAAIAERVEEL